MNKHQKVREHLLEHGSITSWEAINLYGATRLSAIIFDLRKTMIINTEMEIGEDRFGNTTQYARYWYIGGQSK